MIERTPESFTRWYTNRHRALIAPNTVDHELGIVINRAKGTRLWDRSGKEYIDFDASVAVSGIGHNHPKIQEMRAKQQEQIDFVEATGRLYAFELEVAGKKYDISEVALAETLLPLAFPSRTQNAGALFTVTGKMAVDAAIALTLKARPERTHYIGFERQFSGRLGFAGEFTYSKPIQRQDYPNSGITVHHLPFPETPEDVRRATEMLNFIPMKSVNAVLCEPVQGEGGITEARFLNLVIEEILGKRKENEVRLIYDEIQAGLGRTGAWFSHQVNPMLPAPDMVLVGKAIGAGLPVSAVLYQKDIFGGKHDEKLQPGWLSGTFPGYPAGIASAIMTLDIIEKEKLIENAVARGDELAATLADFSERMKLAYGDYEISTKGLGLMRGIAFRKYGKPDAAEKNKVLRCLREHSPIGILTLGAGIDEINPTVRFLPPLTVTTEEIGVLGEALTSLF